jgi:uncharacterized protein
VETNPNKRATVSVSEASMDLVKRTVLEWLNGEDVVVVLFGSRATGTEHRHSDFDVGVLPGPRFEQARLSALREVLEELNIPYVVELVDLSLTSAQFRDKALAEAIVWIS